MGADESALELITRYVQYGYGSAEIERIVTNDVFDGKAPSQRLRSWIKAAVSAQRDEQESWLTVTDCDRLDRAFTALRASHILAIHDAGYTLSEGITEQYLAAGGKVSPIVGYCFYHSQDMDHALLYHKLGLAYGDIQGDDRRGVEVGQRVRVALEMAGLAVEWSGSIEVKMDITPFQWQRRV